MVKGLSIMLQK